MHADQSKQLLQTVFGHSNFREGQEAVVESLLEGRSALAVFPTGGGKSLCYQLPALMLEGITVVVSPLIALMKDQVETLQALGVGAARIDSSLEYSEIREIYAGMESGAIKLIYVAPERLGNEGFLRKLRRCRIALLAIDEAHCISEWGHNFRPDYLKLAELAKNLQVDRILALTATATPEVSADICRAFSIEPEDHIQTPFFRQNLEFRVTPCVAEDKIDKLCQLIESRPKGPTIVYVTLQRTAEEVAAGLTKSGLRARAYHAGMRDDHRSELQDDFMADREPVIVATIAFGMGIDKPDIRYVYHYNLPKSLENYVQESGRAGRDGQMAVCEILASASDMIVLENFVYGDTPSASSIKSLVEHLVLQGEEFSISKYDLSASKDIRPLVISTALTYLEIDTVLIPKGPYYSGYKYRFLQPLERVLADYDDARRAFLQQVFDQSKKGRTWFSIDVEEAASSLNQPVDRIRKALDYLSEMGDIRTQPSGLRFAYRLNSAVDTSVNVLTERLMGLFENREAGEISRLQRVVDYCESPDCLAGRLVSYFGDDAVSCGQCSSCQGNAAGELPSAPERDLTEQELGAIRGVFAEKHQALRQPRQLARFLCGISSPATTRSKLHRDEQFGMLAKVPFQDVLAYVETLV